MMTSWGKFLCQFFKGEIQLKCFFITLYLINHTKLDQLYTVKPAHVITSIIKQSPIFKGHLFLSCHRKFSRYCMLRDHVSYKAAFSLLQRWPLNTGLTVHKRLWLKMDDLYILILSMSIYPLIFTHDFKQLLPFDKVNNCVLSTWWKYIDRDQSLRSIYFHLSIKTWIDWYI